MRTLPQSIQAQSKPLLSRVPGADKAQVAGAAVWGKRLAIFLVLAWSLTFIVKFETMLTVMNLVGLLMAAAGLRYRAVGLIGIALLCTLDTLSRNLLANGGLWRWNTINYWLMFVVLINLPFILRFHDFQSRILQVFLILLVLMLPISYYVSIGIQDILNIGASFGIVFYFSKAIREKNVLYWVGIVSGTAAALGGLAFYLQMSTLPYINPNSLTQLPLSALFAACLAMPEAMKIHRGRPILLLLSSINVVWVFLSGSRGSLLTAFVCLLFLIMQMRSFTWTTFLIAIGLGLLFWFSNIMLDQQVYALHRFSKFLDSSYTLAQRTSGRSTIFWTGWQIFLQKPFGIGTGSFRAGSETLMIVGGKSMAAHSAWIKTLAENGAQGFLLLATWVISFAVAGLRSKNRDLVLLGLFTTAILVDVFITQEFQGKNLWFLVSGATILLNADKFEPLLDKPGIFAKRYRRRQSVQPKVGPISNDG